MLILPVLRSVTRYSRGQRPCIEDLDAIVRDLRRRRERGLPVLSPDKTCVCGATTTQILDIVGRADHMVKVGSQSFYPQEVGDALLAFPDLVLPPRFTLRAEQREDAQYVLLNVEHDASLSPEQVERLRQRIADQIMLSQIWLVKVGVAKLVVNLHPAGSVEHPFPYKHRHLVLAQRP